MCWLDDECLEVVYMWVDGVYVKAGLEKEKAADRTDCWAIKIVNVLAKLPKRQQDQAKLILDGWRRVEVGEVNW